MIILSLSFHGNGFIGYKPIGSIKKGNSKMISKKGEGFEKISRIVVILVFLGVVIGVLFWPSGLYAKSIEKILGSGSEIEKELKEQLDEKNKLGVMDVDENIKKAVKKIYNILSSKENTYNCILIAKNPFKSLKNTKIKITIAEGDYYIQALNSEDQVIYAFPESTQESTGSKSKAKKLCYVNEGSFDGFIKGGSIKKKETKTMLIKDNEVSVNVDAYKNSNSISKSLGNTLFFYNSNEGKCLALTEMPEKFLPVSKLCNKEVACKNKNELGWVEKCEDIDIGINKKEECTNNPCGLSCAFDKSWVKYYCVNKKEFCENKKCSDFDKDNCLNNVCGLSCALNKGSWFKPCIDEDKCSNIKSCSDYKLSECFENNCKIKGGCALDIEKKKCMSKESYCKNIKECKDYKGNSINCKKDVCEVNKEKGCKFVMGLSPFCAKKS